MLPFVSPLQVAPAPMLPIAPESLLPEALTAPELVGGLTLCFTGEKRWWLRGLAGRPEALGAPEQEGACCGCCVCGCARRLTGSPARLPAGGVVGTPQLGANLCA